jgi:hypothetical protein
MGEAAQADYSSDCECSHGADATRRAMHNGLIYAPGPRLAREEGSINKGPTELAPYTESMRCKDTVSFSAGSPIFASYCTLLQ